MAAASPKMCTPSYIDLPSQTAESSAGLGIDIGGSTIKLVYRPKEKNIREGEPPIAEGRERIRLSVFSRTDIDTALKEIADHADIRRKDDKDIPTIYTTGVGSNQMKAKLTERLCIDTKNLGEVDMFVKCFKELCAILPYGEVTDPLNEKGSSDAKKTLELMFKAMLKVQEYSESDLSAVTSQNLPEEEEKELSNEVPYAQADKDLFPCHIAMLGSAFGVLQLNKEGDLTNGDISKRGGASFLGIGRVLAGTSSFEELVSLAEEGSDHDVSVYSDDLAVDTGADDMYKMAADMGNVLAFSFGKMRDISIDSVSKASLIRALLVHYATDISMFVQLRALLDDVSNVFFAGNFANAEIIREELSRYILLRKMGVPPGKKQIRYHFLKHGGFYGALGAFLHKEKEATQ